MIRCLCAHASALGLLKACQALDATPGISKTICKVAETMTRILEMMPAATRRTQAETSERRDGEDVFAVFKMMRPATKLTEAETSGCHDGEDNIAVFKMMRPATRPTDAETSGRHDGEDDIAVFKMMRPAKIGRAHV